MKSFRKWIKNKKEMHKLRKLMPVQLYGSTDRHAVRVIFSFWKFHPPKERWQKSHQRKWEDYHKESFLAMSKEELELNMAWPEKGWRMSAMRRRWGNCYIPYVHLFFQGLQQMCSIRFYGIRGMSRSAV